MPDNTVDDFADNIRKMGVDTTQYDSDDFAYLMKVAKLCTKQSGIPLGLVAGVATSGVTSITIPVIGAVPGYVAGFLAGVLGGTVACTISRMSIKRGLDDLLDDNQTRAKANLL
jgi:hypothetical protein